MDVYRIRQTDDRTMGRASRARGTPVPDPSPNWIVATGQIWKLYLALAGFVAALGCFTAGVFFLGVDQNLMARMTGAGVLLAVATLTWLASALRCPHCLAKLVWVMLRTRPHTSWLIDLAGLDRCPVCRRQLDRGTP